MYREINSLRELLLSAGAKYPFDIFDICSKFNNLEIETCPFKTVGLRGMAVLADSENSINCILVNSDLSNEEQNFHGIHELVHIYTSNSNSAQTFQCYDKVKPFQDSYIEWIANEGAAELILPYSELLPFIKNNISIFNEEIFPIYQITEIISQNYNISPIVAQNRINNLKYEIYQYLNGTNINDISIISKRQQEALDIHIDSLIDIENRRMCDFWLNKKTINKSFFDYSDSYKNIQRLNSL